MENLGAITFRETALLVDESTATHAERERVADVVAHENAHMWFGDLVTMSWWNGLWLNEAFATFMEMLAVDAWKPEWQRWTTFGVSRSAALSVDGLHSTRPIEFPVEAPKDADAMFDVLTYEKGASVLRMLEQYVGPDVFRDGVRRYLERHAFGSTETGRPVGALGEASELPIPEVMDGWIFRPGYPLIDVPAWTAENRLVLRSGASSTCGEDAGPAEKPVVADAGAGAAAVRVSRRPDRSRRCSSGGRRSRCRWAVERRAGQRGRPRLLPRPLRPGPAGAALGRARPPGGHRALQPRQRRLGRRAGRPDAARPSIWI